MFPTRILLATDGSQEASLATEAAVELSNGTGSELHVVYVVPTVLERPYPRAGTEERTAAFLEQKRLHGLRLLEVQAKHIGDLGGSVAASHYREGKPETEVVDLGKKLDAGLIMTGGQKRPWFERIFGAGFSETVRRRADRPVLVVSRRGLQGTTVPR
jgi:nucleotide-binding universal stress UspA family protein